MRNLDSPDMRSVLSSMDSQLASHGTRLEGLRIPLEYKHHLASSIASEASMFSGELRRSIRESSPVPISDRLAVVEAGIQFNAMSCTPERFQQESPGLAYAYYITSLYIAVVYLGDGLYEILKKGTPPPSTSITRRCAEFLRENPVRAFRNAFSHGNWKIHMDCPGPCIKYWAYPGKLGEGEMREYKVTDEELIFWFTLARSFSFAVLLGASSEASHQLN